MAAKLESDEGLAVGAILHEARRRQRIDLSTVEERTKIRGKYLRALEDEDWDVLPGPAYARGFIRAYAELLDLDSEMLVDQYRRRHEGPSTSTYELAEPLLSGHRPDDPRRSAISRRLIVAAIVALAVILLLLLGLTAGSEDDRGGGSRGGERGERPRPQGEGEAGAGGGEAAGRPQEVRVRFVAQSDLQACVIDAADRVLIPDQLLSAGTEEGPFSSRRFRIELTPGTARIVVNGERAAGPSDDPVAFRLTSRGLRPVAYRGTLCQ